MKIENHPFEIVDWTTVEKVEYKGIRGFAIWQTKQLGDIRIRKVEYSVDYMADHWCLKGHIIYCIKGKMTTEMKNGETFKLRGGMSYHVGDDCSQHRSFSKRGCTLFIVD